MIERVAIRPMLGRPFIAVVMVTFGVGSIIRGVVGIVWGPDEMQIPSILSRTPNREDRPLLSALSAEQIQAFLKEREVLYRQAAHIAIETSGREPEQAAEEIAGLELFRKQRVAHLRNNLAGQRRGMAAEEDRRGRCAR